jgi:hypothetical protein
VADFAGVAVELGADHTRPEAHGVPVGADPRSHDAPWTSVGADHTRPGPHATHVGADLVTTDAQIPVVGADHRTIVPAAGRQATTAASSAPSNEPPTPERPPVGADEIYAMLRLDAAALDGLESVRMAAENRLRDLRERKGGGDHLTEARAALLVDLIAEAEHQALLNLQRTMRATPVADFVATTVGLGLKQTARLLAAIGNPAWNATENRPRRGPAELWRYCGLDPVDGAARRRRRGEHAAWNHEARKRAWLVAQSCVKQPRSPYRAVYDAGRAKYADQGLTPLHEHNRAVRLVAKAVLRDLWREARK